MQQTAPSNFRLLPYLIVTILLVAIGAASLLLAPRGTQLQRCEGLWLGSVRDTCLQNLALATSNYSICALAHGAYATSCYTQVADKTNNSAVCNAIGNSSSRDSCVYAIATGRGAYSLCKSIGEPYRSSCVYSEALASNDTALCSGIANGTASSECRAVLYTRIAVARRNSSYCSEVPNTTNSTIVNAVYSNANYNATAAAFGGGSFLSQLQLSQGTSAQAVCYAFTAAGAGSTGLCSGIANFTLREACLLQPSRGFNYTMNATGNATQISQACQGIGGNAQLCSSFSLLAVAVKTRNVSICSGLLYGMDTYCYVSLAVAYKNTTYCSYIVNATERATCTSGV